MIDVSPLNAIYGNNIPVDLSEAIKTLETLLTKQKQYVKEVVLLPNASVDKERALHLQKTLSQEIKYVLQGVLVTVKPEYKLSYEDAIWFHPEMAKGRSVYKLTDSITQSDLDKIKEIHHLDGKYDKDNCGSLSPFNCDVGEYSQTSVDDMGMVSTTKHLIVNVSQEALTYPLWSQYLMSGESCGKVYSNWNSMDMGNGKNLVETSLNIRNKIASVVMNCTKSKATSSCVYTDEINGLYSDGHSVYFANHAIKTPKGDNARILVHVSALAGYEIYNIKSDDLFVPSNLGLSEKIFDWDNMKLNQRKRIFNDCSWEGDEGFNTYVLSAPSMSSRDKENFELKYNLTNSSKFRMCRAKFSSQPVRDIIDIGQLARLTPREDHLEGIETQRPMNVGKEIRIPLSLSYEPLKKLVDNFEKISLEHPEFKLFNEKIVENGYIKIPREIINKLN